MNKIYQLLRSTRVGLKMNTEVLYDNTTAVNHIIYSYLSYQHELNDEYERLMIVWVINIYSLFDLGFSNCLIFNSLGQYLKQFMHIILQQHNFFYNEIWINVVTVYMLQFLLTSLQQKQFFVFQNKLSKMDCQITLHNS